MLAPQLDNLLQCFFDLSQLFLLLVVGSRNLTWETKDPVDPQVFLAINGLRKRKRSFGIADARSVKANIDINENTDRRPRCRGSGCNHVNRMQTVHGHANSFLCCQLCDSTSSVMVYDWIRDQQIVTYLGHHFRFT